MHISQCLFRTVAVAAMASAATLSLSAQQSTTASAPQATAASTPAANTLLATNLATDSETVGYSSSAGASETAEAVNYIPSATHASMAMQPPPRRYGRRPVYADSAHNADGSNKYTFFGGGGFTLPTGGSHSYLSTSYDFQAGGGRQFNKNFALLAQFDWHNFAIQTNTLNNLLTTYQNLCGVDCTGSAISQISGHTHIWSFTLDPTYTFAGGDKAGAYVVAGAGFYHKVTDFTTPGVGEYCDPYYGCYEYEANQTIDSYVSNAFGVNGGVGFTYKPSRFGNERLYGEARYVYTANSSRPYYDGATGTAISATYFNVFPQNSARTTYIPVTFGIRF